MPGVKRADSDGTLRLFWWHGEAESRMKTVTAVKTKAKKTNNQASFGGSILKANMEVEAAIANNIK